ncbi:FkbM family methyltransferase [uncultured Dokdonia sp.]|uniref:FkbM family methyltransferase n=1 Tax=uncultured Dokdonia sp. TaxID=575653 RepID=UPI002634C467|nr:FkbM family methyltransferase [uncultured Dokdonia sp.]
MRKIKVKKRQFKIKLRKKVLGDHAKGVIYDTENGMILAPIDDYTIGRYLGFKGGWNISEIKELLTYIHKDDTVYVLGTHIGTLLVPIGKQCKTIVGYEANPDTFGYVSKNVLINDLENATLFNFAVGDAEKKISFYKNTLNSGGSKIKPLKDSYLYSHDNPDTVEVAMIRLDDHIQKENLPKPDHIIVDIEGAEYFALQGMQDILTDVKMLYIEYVPHHLKNVSGATNKEFVDLILPHFDKVRFVGQKKEIDLHTSKEAFLSFLDSLYTSETADDLLFTKEK